MSKYDKAEVRTLREMDRQRIEEASKPMSESVETLEQNVETLEQTLDSLERSVQEHLDLFGKVRAQRDAMKAALEQAALKISTVSQIDATWRQHRVLSEIRDEIQAALAMVKG